MTKKDIVQALVDYYELTLDGETTAVTDENLGEWLSDYNFQSGAYLGYGGPWLSLSEVCKALECLCEDAR